MSRSLTRIGPRRAATTGRRRPRRAPPSSPRPRLEPRRRSRRGCGHRPALAVASLDLGRRRHATSRCSPRSSSARSRRRLGAECGGQRPRHLGGVKRQLCTRPARQPRGLRPPPAAGSARSQAASARLLRGVRGLEVRKPGHRVASPNSAGRVPSNAARSSPSETSNTSLTTSRPPRSGRAAPPGHRGRPRSRGAPRGRRS